MHLAVSRRATIARTTASLCLPNSMRQLASPVTWIGAPFAVAAVHEVWYTLAPGLKILSSTRVLVLPVSARHCVIFPLTRPFAVSWVVFRFPDGPASMWFVVVWFCVLFAAWGGISLFKGAYGAIDVIVGVQVVFGGCDSVPVGCVGGVGVVGRLLCIVGPVYRQFIDMWPCAPHFQQPSSLRLPPVL
jgi:hypothetical protein